jgi:hypothetical protein
VNSFTVNTSGFAVSFWVNVNNTLASGWLFAMSSSESNIANGKTGHTNTVGLWSDGNIYSGSITPRITAIVAQSPTSYSMVDCKYISNSQYGGDWKHFAFSVAYAAGSPAIWKLSVNGIMVFNDYAPMNYNDSNYGYPTLETKSFVSLGSKVYGNTMYFDHFAMYNRPLTDAEMYQLYAADLLLKGVTGPQSLTGTTGYTGYTGYTGSTGTTGISGPTGPEGIIGRIGSSGQTGPTGLSGPIGQDGKTGSIGFTGPTGNTGSTGYTGITGRSGTSGTTGTTGQNGVDGNIGISGMSGPTASKGTTGNDGSDGIMVVFIKSYKDEEIMFNRDSIINSIIGGTRFKKLSEIFEQLDNHYLMIYQTSGFIDVVYKSVKNKIENFKLNLNI